MSGELSMKSQCLPFTQIPHTTRLFLDYLSYTPSVRSFYPRSPIFSEWVKDESKSVVYDAGRRGKVSEILERQNRAWGASTKTLANIERFRRGALAAVTGQQVGLFGGPLFSIFKALTAVKLAEQATAAGVDCVPIFWLATEDHDLAEVNHVTFVSADGVPERLAIESRGVEDAPVGTIQLGPEVDPVVERAVALLGDTEVSTWLREAYRPGETMGSAFARLMARLFADWGVILLDQADPAFHELAKPILRQAVERSSELDDALLARGTALETAGYHQQVKVTSATTLLFEIKNGVRTVVRRKSNGANDEFVVGEERSFTQELLDRIERNAGNFSPNVLLRPVVQDYLLPTLAYTGGAAEVSYFAQAGVVYEKLLGHVTPIVPRFSATIVEQKPKALLDRYALTLPEIFRGEEMLREKLATKVLPPELQQAFDRANTTMQEAMSFVREELARLDRTLVDAADNARSKIQHQLESLRARAARAEVRQSEVVSRHTQQLTNSLFPNKTLQEREIAAIYYLSRYGVEFLSTLYRTLQTGCHDHQVV